MKYPYFKFSKACIAPKDLISWFNYFKKRNIACIIMQESKRNFALWREGIEANTLAVNQKALRGEIVMKFDPRGVFTDIELDRTNVSLS